MKRITALFLSILLLMSLCVTALGHEAPDLTKKGTITIQWKFQGNALPDGALRAYRVGTLKDTDGNFNWPEWSRLPVPLSPRRSKAAL